ncbi:mitochondrial ribosomal protein subunit L20-domain-containing protein [Plectosphaerella plurivora]|uniref:Mitochondrial ribosomal protein subunit L20-domain-containing protein n=1 Tax=Plectosphaerella plurivora TaxID=936078 RepID=A0A9P9AE26_9PEZI|nr:mitochondrial ribosomal protein subunit L20-domain-containing protein [Plectosphaerella plurivora]
MDARALVRPAAQNLLAAVSSQATVASRRSHQTWSRTKRALNIAPHPDYAPSRGSDAIIFNPPAAEPSVLHTPYKFLPKTDPRRRHADLSSLFTSPVRSAGATSTSGAEPKLPPALNFKSRNPSYHLSQMDVAEIRRLRAEDPVTWSVTKLADKFNCSKVFITICTAAPREHKEKLERRLEITKSRWGAIRTKARSERTKRKEMLFRGEL